MNQKPLFLAIFLTLLVAGIFLASVRPQFPVEYRGLSGVDDYINGNSIVAPGKTVRFLRTTLYGWEDHTKEPGVPLVTEDDWIFYVIDNHQQKVEWGIEYSKEDLIKISERDLEWIRKDNKNGSRDKQIARIQSFIDILSRR